MYVCICHALNEADVKLAKRCGARTPEDVHEHFGVEVQCGSCLDAMREILKDSSEELDPAA